MKEYLFTATLQPAGGGGVFIPFPHDAKKEFGKGKVPIQCTIDGEPYRGTMVKYGTPYHVIIVLKAIREKIKKGAGDKVKVWLIEDKEERTVDVPDDFKKLLKKSKLDEAFNKMSFTHRKEWMLWLADAKKPETRERRMHQAVEKLKEKLSKG
jgi:hypothetical protein